MNSRAEALSLWQRLADEFERYQQTVTVLPTTHLRVQDDMRRYLCLRCAGFLEQATYVILSGYIQQKTSGPAQDFINSFFKQAPNLTVDAFTKLVGRFGPRHSAELETFLTRARRETLGDLLSIRNDVAHGRIYKGQRLQPDRYVRLCEEIYEWLVETFLGNSVEELDDSGKEIVAYERTK